ncbi:MAG: aminomethyl transferase family protein [Candidatus Cloacimonetes bacterium]|nr:aminomethyl transferase family protein [Candidatus Cloacimonadota bacterium]
MNSVGIPFPATPRKTALFEVEDWYQRLLAQRLDRPYAPIKRSNFGQYDMAVNYITSVLEEARAINKLAIFNIDHMAQIRFTGPDAAALLDRVLPARVAEMKTRQCKYTLLLNEDGSVRDDLIVMRRAEHEYILVINAGHDITNSGEEHKLLSDADFILSHMRSGESVTVEDISERLVKIDPQGPLSFRLIKELYGEAVLKNPRKPEKNMGFFSFNEFTHEGHDYILSRTGYTNRWGWELYVPIEVAAEQFKRIMLKTLELGGLLVGLGGRDENRLSAGVAGLPLMGHEYDGRHLPTGAPLFAAAIDMTKDHFVGKIALDADSGNPKGMAVIISEGIAVGRGVYCDGKRLGTVTSSINSPNVPIEKRLALGSKRRGVNEPDGTAAIGLAWLHQHPWRDTDDPQPIHVECYREDDDRQPKGKPVLAFLSPDGVNPGTAHKPLRHIEKL